MSAWVLHDPHLSPNDLSTNITTLSGQLFCSIIGGESPSTGPNSRITNSRITLVLAVAHILTLLLLKRIQLLCSLPQYELPLNYLAKVVEH